MLEPRPISPASNHEELFTQRYQWLMNWALRMTGQDKAQAQDLVHDTFVQFVISRPPLEAIQQNLEGYLYTMLRWADGNKLDLSGLKNLMAYKDRVAARPTVQQALTKEGLMNAA